MRRRLIAGLTAVAMALFGGTVLVRYVQAADERARAGEELVSVLVVDEDIPPGADAITVRESVSPVEVPARLVAPGSMTDLAAASGKVTNSTILAGEQLLAERFTHPAEVAPAGTVLPDVPGMVEVSVALDAQRAAGGVLKAGDRVGVQLTSQENGTSGLTSLRVFDVFNGVLVTRVVGPADPTDPAASYLVTLALRPADASSVVLGSTAQSVWLSLEKPALVPPAGSSAASTTATLGDDK